MFRRPTHILYWSLAGVLCVMICGIGIAKLAFNSESGLKGFGQSAAVASAINGVPTSTISNWLIQDVCVKNGQVLTTDPGADNGKGCADAGATERDLLPGENLPYHKLTQGGSDGRDSYPVISTTGQELYVTTHDYDTDGQPFGIFKWWDGLGVFGIDDNYSYIADTDGAGFSTTFFGNGTSGCILADGWLFFPQNFLNSSASTGHVALPIGDSYWQQEGTAWPGTPRCGNGVLSDSHITSWVKIPSFTYGSVGHITTSLPTILVVHGMPEAPNSSFLKFGHLEIFYFTPQYGYTRWESWFPNKQLANAANTCTNSYSATMDATGLDSMTLNGITFYRQGCSDNTLIVKSTVPGGDPLPIMPIPEMNFLSNWSFANGLSGWKTSGAVTMHAAQSRTCPDTTVGSNPGQDCGSVGPDAGVRYVTLACTGTTCSSGAMYQDIPLSSSSQLTSGTYAFAAQALKESGTGPLTFTLSQVDSSGAITRTNSFTVNAVSTDTHYGKTYFYNPSTPDSGYNSVIWASTFYGTTTSVVIAPTTVSLRLSISPGSIGSYDIIDTWVMKQNSITS